MASLVIATCGLSSVLIINTSAKQSYANNDVLLLGEVKYQVIAKNPQSPLTKNDYAELRQQGFSELIAISQSSTHIYHNSLRLTNRRVVITGIDTVSLLPLLGRSNDSQFGELGLLASMPFSQSIGIVHPKLLAQLTQGHADKSAGLFSINTYEYNDSNSPSDHNTTYLPTLSTLQHPSLGNDLVTDIGEYFRLFPNAKLNSLLLLSQRKGELHQAFVVSLKTQLPEHLQLVLVSDGEQPSELSDSFHMNLLAMALLMFVVCLFIVINAVNLLINARMPWFKICRQLGISRYQIFACQIIEILFLTFIATCVGIIGSVYLAALVAPTVQATLEGLFGVQVGYGSSELFFLFIQVYGISAVGCIAATIAPFWASNQSLSAIKSTPHANEEQWRGLFWLCAFLFAIISLLLLNTATQLWLLLIATALLILSGCCLLLANYPQALNIIYRLIPARYFLLKLSTKQSIALSGKTKVACCAFFIAATSNIGMNLMVDSFRGATISWLESRLTTDYYLYYDGDKDIASIAKAANVTLFQRYENSTIMKGHKVQQYSYPSTVQFKNAMVFEKAQDDPWQLFDEGKAAFINQQFAFTFDLRLGDNISVTDPTSKKLEDYLVTGIYYDFGNPHKQMLLPLTAFDSQTSPSSIFSVNADEAGIARFRQALEEATIDFEQSLFSTSELLARSKDTFDRTFMITDGLNIVTLLVAALSLACAIIVLMDTTRPQNMLIRSLGVSIVKTQCLALFQYGLLCLVALVFATPFGILLSWVLIYDINLQAFQWTYPLHINFSKIVYIYAISLSVVLAVIALPILRASNRPLIEDIRWLS